MITVHALSYNEEIFIQFMIDHYRTRFPNCNIVFYDNMSTDNTVNIAIKNNCQVVSFDTGNKIYDNKYLEIKNSCWKSALTDWVLVCDMDELLDITAEDLKRDEFAGYNIISAKGYNMVNFEDNFDFASIKYGYRNDWHDKMYLFNKKYVTDIKYLPGCHKVEYIQGPSRRTEHAYPLYHYKHINQNYEVARTKLLASRLSDENKKAGFAGHYSFSEETIRSRYYRDDIIKLIP